MCLTKPVFDFLETEDGREEIAKSHRQVHSIHGHRNGKYEHNGLHLSECAKLCVL